MAEVRGGAWRCRVRPSSAVRRPAAWWQLGGRTAPVVGKTDRTLRLWRQARSLALPPSVLARRAVLTPPRQRSSSLPGRHTCRIPGAEA